MPHIDHVFGYRFGFDESLFASSRNCCIQLEKFLSYFIHVLGLFDFTHRFFGLFFLLAILAGIGRQYDWYFDGYSSKSKLFQMKLSS